MPRAARPRPFEIVKAALSFICAFYVYGSDFGFFGAPANLLSVQPGVSDL